MTTLFVLNLRSFLPDVICGIYFLTVSMLFICHCIHAFVDRLAIPANLFHYHTPYF